MKQKIIIKIQVKCDKCRSKAMRIVAVADGVISVAIEGEDKDKLVVIGDGVDAASLTSCLRKKVGYATLITVEAVKSPEEIKKAEEKKKEEEKKKKEEEEKKKGTNPIPSTCSSGCCQQQQMQCELYKVVHDPYPSTCTIM